MTDKMQINNVIEAVLEEHVAATRSQRVQIRELLLDGIEQAGFVIVGKPQPFRREDYHPPHPTDYGRTRTNVGDGYVDPGVTQSEAKRQDGLTQQQRDDQFKGGVGDEEWD